MDEGDWLAERFEAHRPRLHAVAHRMLGSAAEADDAMQEAWLRLSRSGADGVENMGGWLTTIVARVCLDLLRSRQSRREEPVGEHLPEIRARILGPLAWAGVELDAAANEAARGAEACISSPQSAIKVQVVPVDEERALATAALAVVRQSR